MVYSHLRDMSRRLHVDTETDLKVNIKFLTDELAKLKQVSNRWRYYTMTCYYILVAHGQKSKKVIFY